LYSFFFTILRPPPTSSLFPSTTLFRSIGIGLPLLEGLGQSFDVHDGPRLAIRVRESLQLGHPPLERDLATLEPELGVVARQVAFRTPAGGLPLARRLPPPDASAVARGTLGRFQVVELHA